jgi:hypothetical protein
MFESIDKLVEESDQQQALEADAEPEDELVEPTLEYYFPLIMLLIEW